MVIKGCSEFNATVQDMFRSVERDCTCQARIDGQNNSDAKEAVRAQCLAERLVRMGATVCWYYSLGCPVCFVTFYYFSSKVDGTTVEIFHIIAVREGEGETYHLPNYLTDFQSVHVIQ